MMTSRRDLSISLARAGGIVLLLSLPVVISQIAVFTLLHGAEKLQPTWGMGLLIVLVLAGVVIHESIHAAGWVIFGRKPCSAIRFGFQWQTLTPYAHLTVPVEVKAYRLGAFMPGLVLGILVYILSLVLGNGNLFWFSLIHTSAAGGDWLVLWLIRHVRAGAQVQDHPTRAGCYVLET